MKLLEVHTKKDLFLLICFSFAIKFLLFLPYNFLASISLLAFFLIYFSFAKDNAVSVAMSLSTAKIDPWIIFIAIFSIPSYIILFGWLFDQFPRATFVQQIIFLAEIPFWGLSIFLDTRIAKYGWQLEEENLSLQTDTPVQEEKESLPGLSYAITPLLEAIPTKDISLVRTALTGHPEDLNTAYAQNGNTPLHVAALNGYTDIVRLLLEQPGIDTARTNNEGKTALDLAREKGCTEVVQLLENK